MPLRGPRLIGETEALPLNPTLLIRPDEFTVAAAQDEHGRSLPVTMHRLCTDRRPARRPGGREMARRRPRVGERG